MAKKRWETGSQVKWAWGGKTLSVVGYDSVGSVICREIDDPRKDLYVSPSLLVSVDAATTSASGPVR
jgi:hypothetical protein